MSTQVHLATDGRRLPRALVITTGNTNDSTVFPQLMDTIRVPRYGPGRPRTPPNASSRTRRSPRAPRTFPCSAHCPALPGLECHSLRGACWVVGRSA
ncbi:transposase [Spiractinospora alimapuensis]|uniref:transposase n=1 Tax=Spiractinospora alimapuensis TaxID=2820884 RepID=UPI00374203E3